MANSYRAIIRIRCFSEMCVEDHERADVLPSCAGCLSSASEIIDLDGNVLFDLAGNILVPVDQAMETKPAGPDNLPAQAGEKEA